MSICCLIKKAHYNPNICFTTQHMYLPLLKYFDGTEQIIPSTKIVLLLDFSVTDKMLYLNVLQDANNKGITCGVILFDPFFFPYVRTLADKGLIHRIWVTDQKFKDRFGGCNTTVTDFYFNEDLFPTPIDIHNNRICYFGHLSHDRILPPEVEKIDRFAPSSFIDLYKKTQEYKGLYVFDTGVDEDGKTIAHYNKAKAIEALLCGRNAYVSKGINTLQYNDFLTPLEDMYITEKKINQSFMLKINQKVVEKIVEEIKELY